MSLQVRAVEMMDNGNIKVGLRKSSGGSLDMVLSEAQAKLLSRELHDTCYGHDLNCVTCRYL